MSNSLYQAQSLWLIAEGARMLIQPLGCIERQDRSTKEMWIRMRCAFSDRSPSLGIKILSIPVPFHIWSSVNIGFPWYNSLIGYQMDSTDSRTTLDSIVQCFFYIFHGANANETSSQGCRADMNASKLWSFDKCHGNQCPNHFKCFRFFHFVFLRGRRCYNSNEKAKD